MIQRLSKAFAQLKAGNNSQSLLMKLDKLFILYISQKQITKKV